MSKRRPIQEFTNQRDCISRSFFHQPMSRARDDLFLHVGRDMPHDHSLEGAKRLLPTYGHHRHRQLRLFEDLVVVCILGESRKLREPGPHSAWLRVSGGKEISSGLVGLTWIAGKVIPYPVKVDTLPACYKPFRIRSMEVEVPNSRI